MTESSDGFDLFQLRILIRLEVHVRPLVFPALLITTSRLLLLAVPAMLLYVYVLDLKIYGVWLGIITGNVLAAGMSALWTARTLRRLRAGSLQAAKT